MKILVAGAGGFIGGHLVRALLEEGHQVRAVDTKPMDEWYQQAGEIENRVVNLQEKAACFEAAEGCEQIFNLAADMGGMGFIENNRALCMLSVLINTHLLMAAREHGARRFFFASSACVYNIEKQRSPEIVPLKEEDAYPAMPEDGYGWEKLFSERMCRHFMEDFGLETRVARYHNVYGPHGTWEGGREKAPAAACRKVIEAKRAGTNQVEIWGTGEQTRSFMYISDCIEGTQKIMDSDIREPLNLGSSELITINGLFDLAASFAGIELHKNYDLNAPKGVNGRNSDNTLIQERLGWQPSTPLREGLRLTYEWIAQEMAGQNVPAAH